MKKTLIIAISVMAVLLLASCRTNMASSISGGIGFGGGSRTSSSSDVTVKGAGISVSESYLFDFNSQSTGFRLFESGYVAFYKKSMRDIITIGPSWEFDVADNFRVLAGIGPSIGFTFYDLFDFDSSSYSSNLSVSLGLTAVAEARYFVSERVFVGLKGEFGYNFVDTLNVYTSYGSFSNEGHGLNYNVGLILGRNF